MARLKKKTDQKRTRKAAHKKQAQTFAEELHQVEFHRHGMALVPDPKDNLPGIAFFLKNGPGEPETRFCSCSTSRKRTCPHILRLSGLYKTFLKNLGVHSPQEAFRASIWYRIATILADDSHDTVQSCTLRSVHQDGKRLLVLFGPRGKEVLRYFSQGPDALRFAGRFGQVSGKNGVPHRGALLEKLAKLTLSDDERYMLEKGFKTNRQILEQSPWYRTAYHCYREFGDAYTFHPAVEESSGAFTVSCRSPKQDDVFRMVIPSKKVKRLLLAFRDFLPNQYGLSIHPIPLKSLFKVTANTELDLELRPFIQVLQEGGETKLFEREGLEHFQYGDLVYIKELGILAELEPPGKMERRFKAPVKMVLKRSRVPTFLQEFGNELQHGPHIVDPAVNVLQIFRQYDHVEITPTAIDRDWCWLSLNYGFGNSAISLAKILRAKEDGQRFVSIRNGWVDCESPDFDGLVPLLSRFTKKQPANESNQIRLSRMDLFRLKATSPAPVSVATDGKQALQIKRLLELKPARSLQTLKGLASTLRHYQKLGVEWLCFLYENGLGGLLCDDMGLGKTHQAIGFMLSLREHEKITEPFLVVCPTTVLSHWIDKICDHAPGLKAAVFHGGQRDLDHTLEDHNVLLTSYGILRNDIERLQRVGFHLVVFDEIQHLKNPQTLTYQAAGNLKAKMMLGLTGTPIENHVGELKALLDLTVPGYLGTDEAFNSRHVKPIGADPDRIMQKELARLISPFTLRRMKRTVLDELPEKIEDIRTCSLSDDQIKLYRDCISSRGQGLLEVLKKDDKPVPYIHIFALLNLLKQICNHPALIQGKVDDYDQYQSGKWELFKDLVSESLDSGQKVVIYSQYLGMIKIIENFLKTLDVDFVTLTGASRKRGQIISRFNNDPDCRLYVGSLKAGGQGIDLVAASVVIHYDRWWNAAKEDQATDRVHRIGQKRGVHVFKLVTKGTLEEKISAIIDKKRNLMESVVQENDPGLLKTFSRDELIEMLSVSS
ncbi:MAG: hypothetical protein BA865_00875 [Desulfobacterales bacterium S5133MH4]|nr:MAG: hypothetical protein BA865_00875 [Desulfobacterales bacterium S5133MH4]